MSNEAFTGLEASKVLIAFVVEVAVFSYVMLGVGFFSTQKSQHVIQAGIAQTSENIALKGEGYMVSRIMIHLLLKQFSSVSVLL